MQATRISLPKLAIESLVTLLSVGVLKAMAAALAGLTNAIPLDH